MGLKLMRVANPAPAFDPDNPTGAVLELRAGDRLISIRVQVKNTNASIESDILRRYIKKLPASLNGRIEANLELLDASGLIGSGAKHPTSFRGNIRLHNLSSHSPAGARFPAPARTSAPTRRRSRRRRPGRWFLRRETRRPTRTRSRRDSRC